MILRKLTFDRLIAAVLFVALLAMAVRTPADTDVWWHLGAGRAMVTTGHIPSADEFSFTVRGRPWVDVQWLVQVGLYVPFKIVAFPDEDTVTGSQELIFTHYGISSEALAHTARSLLRGGRHE